MTDFLREYIRGLIDDENTSVTEVYYPDSRKYDAAEVLEQATEMAEDLDINVTDRELKFFGYHMDGSVAGAAWVLIKEGRFEFVITLDDEIPDGLHKDLVRDCLEEFDYQNRSDSLILEVSVDNEEDRLVFESVGMVVLREYVDAAIMGIGD